jgi:type I restriction enzyme, R subunit
MDETGKQVEVKVVQVEKPEDMEGRDIDERIDHDTDSGGPPKKYYVDNGSVEIAAHLVYELDGNGKQLRVVKFTDYTAERVRSMCPSAALLRSKWSKAEERAEIIQALEDRGISFEELVAAAKQPDADPFDLVCHVAFNAPLRTRRERAEMLRRENTDFFEQYGPEAREVLTEMLDKYIEYGTAQFQIPEILKVPPISERGTVPQVAAFFGGADKMRAAVSEMQALLYAS